MLVRVAISQYVDTKVFKTVNEGVRALLECMKPHINYMNGNHWRKKEYFVEQIDIVLKAYKPILECLYSTFAGKLSGLKDCMNLDEFKDIFSSAAIFNDCFGFREVEVCFHQSMMTEID